MNKYQRRIFLNVISIILITTVFVVLMMAIRGALNRKEAMRAMSQLGTIILDYKKTNGSLPGDTIIDSIRHQLEGSARLGKVHYRARWVTLDSPPYTILAYDQNLYKWFFMKKENVVLMLDGRVVSLNHNVFMQLLKSQQSIAEITEIEKTQQNMPGLK